MIRKVFNSFRKYVSDFYLCKKTKVMLVQEKKCLDCSYMIKLIMSLNQKLNSIWVVTIYVDNHDLNSEFIGDKSKVRWHCAKFDSFRFQMHQLKIVVVNIM